MTLDDLRQFRQWHSRTPGHPERGETPGVETTTGPLGQGVGNAVGMAMAERFLAERFNGPGRRIVDHRTWALVSDGDLMEGIASEAASLGGHLRLGKLKLIYDRQPHHHRRAHRPLLQRGRGRPLRRLRLARAARGRRQRPRRHRRARSRQPRPRRRDPRSSCSAPSSPIRHPPSATPRAPTALRSAPTRSAGRRRILGWPEDQPFHVPEEAYADMRGAVARGQALEAAWQRDVRRLVHGPARCGGRVRAHHARRAARGLGVDARPHPAPRRGRSPRGRRRTRRCRR